MKKTKYKYLVRALFFCLACQGCSEIVENSLTNQNVVLLAPANNVVSGNVSQSLYWQALFDSTTHYEVEVVSPRFDSIVMLITDTTIQTNILRIGLDSGQYQWRVRAFNNSSTTPFSNPWTLTIN